MPQSPLVTAFEQGAPLPDGCDRERLAARLALIVARATNLVSELEIPEDALSRALSANAFAREALLAEGDATLSDDAVAELVIFVGLALKLRRAPALFDARYVAKLDATLAHMRLPRELLEDVKQQVREKFLVPQPDGALRLGEYVGEGRLPGLIRVTATRTALDMLKRKHNQASPIEDLLELPTPGRDPALAALARQSRDHFRDAFEAAIQTLDQRERNILRLHGLGGVTLEQLASMYGVHRATVVRWLADARQSILSHTRKTLQTTLHIKVHELDSLINLLESGFDLSVERLFRSQVSSASETP